jgi:PAS domain S-box-containing protein
MRPLSTLRRTLSLHFLLVAIIPTLAFGLIAIGLLHQYLQAGIYERNGLLSRDIAATTDEFLAEAERDLTMAANVIAADMQARHEAADDFLGEMVKRSDSFESIYLLGKDRVVENLGIDPRTKLNRDDYHGVDFSRHELFRQHPLSARAVWSDTFVSLATGQPSVTLAVPSGEGVLLGHVSLRKLSQRLARSVPGSCDNCAIVDHAGTLVASSDPELAMQRVNFGLHQGIALTPPNGGGTRFEQHGDDLLLESTASIPRTGWVVWVGSDMIKKMAPVDHVRNLLIWFMVLALLLAASVALADAQRLLLPLSTLSERAVRIGAGDYEARFHSSGFAEIDSLATSLQEMAQAVRDREQLLVGSEQRFRDLVNSIDGVVWEMDVNSGAYLFVSGRSADMLGYPPAEWLADAEFWMRHVFPDDLDRVVIRGRRGLALNEKHDLEYRFLAAGGKPLWIRDLVTVVWAGDEPIRLLGVMIDISERKQTEAELERYRTELEKLVAQRTGELQVAQQELVRKERLAVLGQLTATVSHEIRNPLGTVTNALFMMRETLGPECLARMERPLVLAERSVQRCDGIISELLDFTRQRELRHEPVLLDAWLADTLDEMVWPATLQCRWRFDSGVTVLADPERLRRALVNVVTNALQAMAAKGAEQCLEITTRRLAERCEIVVRDSGEGIPEAISERIFEPLFSTKNFGVGLGVPIIKNIMEDHGGGVSFQSQVGKGTTVTLWLPLPADQSTPAG